MKKFSFVLVLLISISLIQSCKLDDPIVDDNNGVAPELPPTESFIMSFDGFESADTTGLTRQASQNRTVSTYQNWFYSASNVVIWNAVLTINLYIPVASFYESFNHNAEFQGNKTWLWAYDFNGNNGEKFSAKLYGKILDSDEVQWDMYISKEGGFQDVHWYNGITAIDRSYANWTLNHLPNNPTAYLGVEYTRDASNNIASIRYTNINPNSSDKGDYIEYEVDNSSTSDFNKSYDVYRIGIDNLLQIQWNDPEKDGRVKSSEHFGDDEWHCWDTNLMDVDC